jgi:hypothetical protein
VQRESSFISVLVGAAIAYVRKVFADQREAP